jgi:hypothetical protein
MSTLKEMSASREHWSYSSLNQLLNICPLQWAMQRLYREKAEFVPVSLAFGSAFHRTLEALSLQRMEGIQMKEGDARDLFADLWQRQVKEDGNIRYDEGCDADTLRQQGQGLVACYSRHINPEEEVVAINQPFCVPLIDAEGAVLDKPLIGEIDTIVRKGGETTIVDWKTSAMRWNAAKPHRAMQPTLYLYAYTQANGNDGEEVGFRYDIVVKNKTPVFEQHGTTRDADAFARVMEKVKVAERMVQAEAFVPNDEGMYCKTCPYQGACASWHRDRNRLVSLASAAG